MPIRLFTALCLLSLVAVAQGDLRFSVGGPTVQAALGTGLSHLGDLDGDGCSDVVIGAPGENSFDGGIRVLSGKTGSVLYTRAGPASGGEFGYAVSAAGDLNQDGYPDVLVGSLNETQTLSFQGAVRVISGEWIMTTHLGGTPSTPEFLFSWFGEGAGDNFGLVVADLGDVDGDGHPDVGIGAPRDDDQGQNCGSISVFSGATGLRLSIVFGDVAGDQLGHALAAMGDLDGDGFDDWVGAAFNATLGFRRGMARVYSGEFLTRTFQGATPLTSAHYATFYGASFNERFGMYVDGAGDVDGDGFPDLVVGAPSADVNGQDSGSVLVYSGAWIAANGAGLSPSGTGEMWAFHGDLPGDDMGISVARAGDLDGDGLPDLVAGAKFSDAGGNAAGLVRAWSGVDGRVLRSWTGKVPGGQLGNQVSGAGDVNGDGFDDVIFSAPYDATFGFEAGSVEVRSVQAAEGYGAPLGPFNDLVLGWSPGVAGAAHAGLVTAVGADAGSPGILATSQGAASIVLGGATLFLDLTPSPAVLMIPISFDAAGSFVLPIDLRFPPFMAQTFFLQLGEFRSDGNLHASAGLMLHFGG